MKALLSQGVQEEVESFRREGGNKVLVSKCFAFARSPGRSGVLPKGRR